MIKDINSTLLFIVKYTLTAALVTTAIVAVTKLYAAPNLSVSEVSTQKLTSFEVSGETEISTVPDKAEVTLGITVNQPTVAATQSQINSTINNISAALQQLGIKPEDIKTRNYSLNPDIDYTSGAQRIQGYVGNANLQVSVTNFELLNQAIDQATALGANQVGNVQFGLTKDKEKEVYQQARQEAIADTKQKAQEIAGLAGMKLGRIINVVEYQPMAAQPMYAREAMLNSAGMAADQTTIQPGSTTINYSVSLSFETL